MTILWVGITFLAFLGLDIWNNYRGTVKNKTRNRIFMVVEGIGAIVCFVWWVINQTGGQL